MQNLTNFYFYASIWGRIWGLESPQNPQVGKPALHRPAIRDGTPNKKRTSQREHPYQKNYMTRRGKIARLPKKIRDELNQRLQNGEPMAELGDWLNKLKSVREVVKSYFDGAKITVSNVSDWKAGGFVDWEKEEEARETLREVQESSKGFNEVVEGKPVGDCFATLLSVKMVGLAKVLLDKETKPERQWERLCKVHKELSRFRRDDHRAIEAMVRREKWALENQEAQEADDSPGKWMTEEERMARVRIKYGEGRPGDFELLREGRKRFLTDDEKREVVASLMDVGTDEEEEEYEEVDDSVNGEGEGI